MHESASNRLLGRELQTTLWRSRQCRSLYSDRDLIGSLDIVNELDGHSGCVNALSWSRNGQLLASGSDDQHLNIHTYQPHLSNSQFKLTTTVATGHTQNIFSVKFMPHQNDKIVVTAAGDGEVRIFDLEHAGGTRAASAASHMASEGRRRGRNNTFNGVRYLNDGDTDCRVYRSHGDRVKRIVTESSPFLFLTCSEDGEVRQWDLRQPSSAYPSARAVRAGTSRHRSVPPPLISYKRYNLDLNTISCSASQPHYIALGGAHLHAFLHDRRMTGRDRLNEAGQRLSPVESMSQGEQDLMYQATQCVRKFAPLGQSRMKRTEDGHITACKISDARPDEMVVSWSRDHIYSFDLIRSPDASEFQTSNSRRGDDSAGAISDGGRKRKRKENGSQTSLGQHAPTSSSLRPRTNRGERTSGSAALRIRYENGQSEDIPLSSQLLAESETLQHEPLTAREREADQLAEKVIELRSSLFELRHETVASAAPFTQALGLAAAILPQIEQIARGWTYPREPTFEMVRSQRSLRLARESTSRFVQISGVLARALGGKLQTPSGPSPLLSHFMAVRVKNNELQMPDHELFGHDFMKAILLWLESGVGSLIEGFVRPPDISPGSKAAERFPIPEADAVVEALDDILIPRLLRLASHKAVIDLDTNRFETDESRQLFATEKAAVLAFAIAIKTPFADLSALSSSTNEPRHNQNCGQDREVAQQFWGVRVARSICYNTAICVNKAFVAHAFGGRCRGGGNNTIEETNSSSDDDLPVEAIDLLDENDRSIDGIHAQDIANALVDRATATIHSDIPTGTSARTGGSVDRDMMAIGSGIHGNDDDDDDDNEDNNDDDDDDDNNEYSEDENDFDEEDGSERDTETESESAESSELDEEDGVPTIGMPRFMYRSAFERRRLRERVGANVPCSAFTRKYTGHCNARTVKDVNYFGNDDEYVVSGSDDGNFFIWDRKTSELVNVLEGDGEVVNVIQGHPYETMLAVSGIDHTIKIFSPDARAREAARLGNGISAHDPSSFSSLSWPRRIGRRAIRRAQEPQDTETGDEHNMSGQYRYGESHGVTGRGDDTEDDTCVAPTGLSSRQRMQDAYRIMNRNDIDRQGGGREAFISRQMLAQLAMQIRQHRVQAGEESVEDGSQLASVVLMDDCAVQ